MADINIGGTFHSTAEGNTVARANEIQDNTNYPDNPKKQSEINEDILNRVNDLEEDVGTGGSVDERITTAKSEVVGDAGENYNTLGKAEDKIQEEAAARENADNAIIGDAATEYNTLGKVEDKIQEEANTRGNADTTLQGNIDDINDAIGTDGTTGTIKGRIASLEYDVNNAEGSVDTRIEAAKDEIRGDAAAGYNTLGKVEDRFQEFAADVDQRLDTQDAEIALLNGSEVIPVADHTAVTSPVNNVIYREQGVSSYSDWMWDTTVTPFAWKLMATYEPGIDNEPTPGSSNLVKSGGVAANIVYDISAANSGLTYVDLAAALGTGGANIPASIRKGGMSVKFVQSSDNKYVQYRLMATSFSTTPSDWALCSEDVLMENPEFVDVKTDSEGRILWAIKVDGSIYWGAGVPKQVIDYVTEKIAELSLDEYEDIVAFLGNLITGDKTLQELLNEKVDKVEGKSLIDSEYATGVSHVESPEWTYVIMDNNNKVLAGIKTDGSVEWTVGIPTPVKVAIQEILDIIPAAASSSNRLADKQYVDNNISVSNATFRGTSAEGLTEQEFLAWANSLTKDANDYVFWNTVDANSNNIFKKYKYNGTAWLYEFTLSNTLFNATQLAAINSGINSTDKEVVSTMRLIEPSEFMAVETDVQDKILGGRKYDGTKFENIAFEIGGHIIKNVQDVEGRTEIVTDSKGKIISYRDSDGMKHEILGISLKNLELPKDALEQSYNYNQGHITLKDWYVPRFGKVNVKEETFYLTANSGYSDKNGIVLIQVLDSTAGNSTPAFFYVKSTLTPLSSGGYDRTSINENSIRLDFYIAKDCTEVNGRYYVANTLVEGQVVPESVEVTQIVDTPPYKAWSVDKSKHYCTADVDFGTFFQKNNIPVELSYQGNSTMNVAKKSFRITFYKKNNYAKKDKIKIGEWIKLSGYNIKAYYTDSTRIKSPINYHLLLEMWKTRGDKAFPWNTDSLPFNNATGTIEEFPIELWFEDEFYGLMMFGLKKDDKNYMLDGDDDTSGIFVNGDFNNQTTWLNSNASHWSDELGVEGRELAYPNKGDDSVSVETANALNEFFKYTKGFINGEIEINGQIVSFENSMLEERIGIAAWIDYWIGLQVFLLWDNIYGNMILYAGRDKKKFYPFFYDVDQALTTAMGPYVDLTDLCQDPDHHPASITTDVSFWVKFKEEYKDNIINRYAELRKGVLSDSNIENVYRSIIAEIPDTINSMEKQRWNGDISTYENTLKFLKLRLKWLDETNFNL